MNQSRVTTNNENWTPEKHQKLMGKKERNVWQNRRWNSARLRWCPFRLAFLCISVASRNKAPASLLISTILQSPFDFHVLIRNQNLDGQPYYCIQSDGLSLTARIVALSLYNKRQLREKKPARYPEHCPIHRRQQTRANLRIPPL